MVRGLVLSAERWSWSDKLAVALTCIAGILALILLWMERTPTWAGATLAGMVALSIYPVLHFTHFWRARGIAMLLVLSAIGLFGWRIWPRVAKTTSAPAPLPLQAAPQASTTTVTQEAKDSNCSNVVAGGNVKNGNCSQQKAKHASRVVGSH